MKLASFERLNFRQDPLKMNDILHTALATGAFKTLVAAVQVAGLMVTLKGYGPLTLSIVEEYPDESLIVRTLRLV